MSDADQAEASADSPNKAETALKRKRSHRSFPSSTFEEALDFAGAVFRIGAGQPVRRLTLFDQLNKSPESSASRQLITSSAKYGLTKGSAAAESIELLPDGRIAVDEQSSRHDQARIRAKLSIMNIPPFKVLYERFINNKLPATAVLIDAAKAVDIEADHAPEAVETFVVNMRYVGLLQTLSGAERIVSVESMLGALPTSVTQANSAPQFSAPTANIITSEHAQFETTCFYIAPIGEEGSEARKHSDLFLGTIVEPAIDPFKLRVVRADLIDKPGTISRQIIEYIVKSRLVIADLSFHNPNVFYELALRHAVKLPIVQIIRLADRVPFDVNQMRTIHIDTTDIYSFAPKIESYRAEISSQVRRALAPDHNIDTPISVYFPSLMVTF